MLPKNKPSKKVHNEAVAKQTELETIKQECYSTLLEHYKQERKDWEKQLEAERQKIQSLEMEQDLKLNHIKDLKSKEPNKEAKEARFLEAFEVGLLQKLTSLNRELTTLPKDKYGNTIVQFEWNYEIGALLYTINNIFDLVKIVSSSIYNDYYNDQEKENIIIGIGDVMSIVLPIYNRYSNVEVINVLTEAKEQAMQVAEQEAV